MNINRRSLFGLAAFGLTSACTKDNAPAPAPPADGKPKEAPQDAVVVNELQLDYSIIIANGSGNLTVTEQFQFHNGDRFRIRVRPAFEAYVYILNRGPKQKEYAFLYPNAAIKQENPVAAKTTIELPGTDWMTFDKIAGTEHLVLIASPTPLTEFNVPAATIERDEFEERLGRVERDYRPTSSRRVESGGWITLLAAKGSKTALVVRLPLDHRA